MTRLVDPWIADCVSRGLGRRCSKLRKDGTGYKILLTFTNSDTIGVGAVSLVAARDGFLYGTTSAGGSFNGGQGGGGTLYKLNRDGSGVEIVRTFAYVACPFGRNTIIEGRDGVLYSTSETAGGCGDSSLGVKAPLLQASDGALMASQLILSSK